MAKEPRIGWRNSRKDKKARGGSSTAGSSKGTHCMASSLDRFMAGSSRSYKHPGYAEWCKTHKG